MIGRRCQMLAVEWPTALVELAWRLVRYQPRYHAVQKRCTIFARAAKLPRPQQARLKAIMATLGCIVRSEYNGLRIFYTIGSSDCIGETDPPACGFRINLYQMAGNRGGHTPLFCRRVDTNTRETSLRVFRRQFRDRLALHRLDECRFCALRDCLVFGRLCLRLLDISLRAELKKARLIRASASLRRPCLTSGPALVTLPMEMQASASDSRPTPQGAEAISYQFFTRS